MMDHTLLRVNEAAQLLNVSRWTVYRWVEEGRLEATKIGQGSLRIFSRSLASLVERNRTNGSVAAENLPANLSLRSSTRRACAR